MTSMKRFGLAALFTIALTLFTGNPARAQTTLTKTGVERDASGTATLTDVWVPWTWYSATGNSYWDIYRGTLILSCAGLTPGAQYRVGPTGVQRTNKGGLSITYSDFRASDDGTLDVELPIEYVGATWYWNGSEWVGGGEPYQISVARKLKAKYANVLVGTVPGS